MCWFTLDMAYSKPKTTEEDLTVIKFLRKNSNGDLLSPYYKYKYELDQQTEKVPLIAEYNVSEAFSPEVPVINKGYHSFEMPKRIESNKHSIEEYTLHYDKDEKSTWTCVFLSEAPYVCVIPKGTQYYQNDEHEIVSETIIVKEPLMFLTETNE